MTAEKPTTEPSMDDILASIRQIISSDTKNEAKDPSPSKGNEDVLDLTEVIHEEAQHKISSPFEMKEKSEEVPSQKESSKYPYKSPSDYSLETSLDSKRNDIESLAADMEKEDLFSLLKNTQDIKTVSSQEDIHPLSQAVLEDSLISETTFSETLKALAPLNTLDQKSLNQPGHHLSTGIKSQTVEDLVRETLKPLLKEWLDANLPALVHQIVSEQVKNIMHQLISKQPKNTP